MVKKETVSFEEMLDDLKDMLGTPEMYEHTLSMMVLNEEEELIFKRAALHIKKFNPDRDIIQRAYEILILKSFHNKNTNRYDTQNIKGSKRKLSNIEDEKQGILQYINNHLEKIILFIIIIFVILKFL